jgi:hypothetical protein
MLRGVVQDFVERTLGGSPEPFALYLSSNPDISDAEVDRLRQIVERLSDAREKDRDRKSSRQLARGDSSRLGLGGVRKEEIVGVHLAMAQQGMVRFRDLPLHAKG